MRDRPSPFDLDADPTAPHFRTQTRVWRLDRARSTIENRLSRHYETSEADDGPEWGILHARGLLRSRVRFEGTGRETRLRYSTYKTIRGYRVELGLQVAMVLAALPVLASTHSWGWFPAPVGMFPASLDFSGLGPPGILLGVLILLAIIGTLAFLSRGPDPRFSTEGLQTSYATFSWFYVIYSFALVLLIGIYVGTIITLPLLAVLVFCFLFAVGTYANGTLSKPFNDANFFQFEAGEPLFDRAYPHLNIATLALLPGLLAFISWIVVESIAPLEPASLNTPLRLLVVRTAIPLGFGLVFCHWCLSVLQRIESRSINPYRSRFGRAGILVGFLLVNVVVLFLTSLFILLAGSQLTPLFNTVDVHLTLPDIVTVGATIGGLLVASLVAASVQVWCQQRGGIAEYLGTRAARYGNYVLLTCTFGLLSFLSMNVFGILIFGDSAIKDPSPRSIRQGFETRQTIHEAATAIPLPGDVVAAALGTAAVLPILLVGVSWAAHIDGKLRDKLFIRRSGTSLDQADRPVPDDVEITVLDENVFAVAKGNVVGSNRILVGQEIVDRLDDDALDALLAHEAAHFEKGDHLVGLISSAASFFIGGQNVLLALYDLTESEREADRYATERVSRDGLRSALQTCNRLETEAKIGTLATGPAFVGSITSSSEDGISKQLPDGRRRLSALSEGIRAALRAPKSLLFGSVLYRHSHPEYEDRLDLLDLSGTTLSYLRKQTEVTTLWLPRQATVATPVPRSDVETYLREKGASDEQVERTIQSLVADGTVREVWGDHLIRSVDR